MIRLLLLDTSPLGAKGSMVRYARLVDLALNSQPGFQSAFTLQTLRLSLPNGLLSWLPGAVQVWVNHIWILLTAKFRIGRIPHDVLHLLDGSYGYVVAGLGKPAVSATAIATVHDVIPLLQQQGDLGLAKPSLPARWIVERSVSGLRRCGRLIAVSGNTRQDLVRLTGMDPGKISVVSVALDPEFLRAARQAGEKSSTDSSAARPLEPQAGAGQRDRYILHVGHNGSYKNRAGVLRIFAKLKAQCRARLVLAGPPPTSTVGDMVKALSLEGDVEFVVNPEDAELVRLYQGASVFLFPSIYEGFGWPPLEAMALGCPVVCSTAASLPEVVGDAALMASVENEDELASLCATILTDRGLSDSLIEKGRLRASQFTIERMGKQLVDVYRQVGLLRT